MAVQLSLQPAKIFMLYDGETGYLVWADDHLAAILVRLDADFHGDDQGSWNLEAGFGACEAQSCPPFQDLADAIAWVAERVGAPVSSVSALVRRVGNGEGSPSPSHPEE